MGSLYWFPTWLLLLLHPLVDSVPVSYARDFPNGFSQCSWYSKLLVHRVLGWPLRLPFILISLACLCLSSSFTWLSLCWQKLLCVGHSFFQGHSLGSSAGQFLHSFSLLHIFTPLSAIVFLSHCAVPEQPGWFLEYSKLTCWVLLLLLFAFVCCPSHCLMYTLQVRNPL